MLKFIFTLYFTFFVAFFSIAQFTIQVNNIPQNTPADAKIYISGNFNNWNPSDENYLLEKKDSFYFAEIETELNKIEFKFTLGSWEKVETNEIGNDISNRNAYQDEYKTLECDILAWKNISEKISTRSENVAILSDSFYIPEFQSYRRIWIYLPPDYYISEKEYSVLYMHDGQNIFDASTSYSGEWKIDETLNSLYDSIGFALIVVGIENGGEQRVNELTTWENKKYGGGDGKKYSGFIVETLKPFIDENYRTLSDREHTGIMGSSLGGLMSFYMGIEYNEVFSKIGAFSPSFWFSKEVYSYAKDFEPENDYKIYILAGGKESKSIYHEVDKMEKILSAKNKGKITVKKVANGGHNEEFWSEQFKNSVLELWDL